MRVAEECNYMQPQSGRVKTGGRLTMDASTVYYVAAAATASATAGNAADCLAQRAKPSYR